MGHFSMLHYLIKFTVQFPGFFVSLSLSKKNQKKTQKSLSDCGWNSEEKDKQNPITYS